MTCQSYVKNYPKKSANVYDRMGDYYVAVNDKPKAIEFFSKAHRIQENESSRKKLDDLKK